MKSLAVWGVITPITSYLLPLTSYLFLNFLYSFQPRMAPSMIPAPVLSMPASRFDGEEEVSIAGL